MKSNQNTPISTVLAGKRLSSVTLVSACLLLAVGLSTSHAAEAAAGAVGAKAVMSSAAEANLVQAAVVQLAENQDSAATVTQAMRDEFESALTHKSAASSRTYGKLVQKRKDEVVRVYFAQGRSMDNMMMTLFEQLSAQIKEN